MRAMLARRLCAEAAAADAGEDGGGVERERGLGGEGLDDVAGVVDGAVKVAAAGEAGFEGDELAIAVDEQLVEVAVHQFDHFGFVAVAVLFGDDDVSQAASDFGTEGFGPFD